MWFERILLALEAVGGFLAVIGHLTMDACIAVKAHFFDRRTMTYNDFKSLDNLTPQILDLLKHVYSVLYVAALAAALGMKLLLPFPIGLKIIPSVGCFIGCRYVLRPESRWPKVLLLLATAFFFGASIGSLAHGTKISKGIMIFVELAWTIFSCFIAGATSPRRIDMHAMAVSPCSLRFVSWLIIASDGHPIDFLQIFSVTISFISLLLYVMVYSQDLVAQARLPHVHVLNFAEHAVYFFSDFLAITVHVIVILLWRSFRRGNGGNGGNGGRGTHPRGHPNGENKEQV